MDLPGQYTEQEILSQPEAWSATLELIAAQAGEVTDFVRQGRYEAVVFTGCGSTYYLALAAAALLQQEAGVPARGLPASEVWLHPRAACPDGQRPDGQRPDGRRSDERRPGGRRTLLVAVSRSGETTETVRASKAFQSFGDVLTLSCYPGKPLTALGELNLVFPAGQEESVAQTRAFTTLYLATAALAALWAGCDDLMAELAQLPAAGRQIIEEYRPLARRLGQDLDLDRFYFLGSGPRYGLACELSLKMKEMTLSHSEPFHFLEFRHGPMSMANPATLLVGLVSSSDKEHESAVLEQMRARGVQILDMGEESHRVSFRSSLSQVARDVLYLPVGQLLALERARARGLNPDRPENLSAVVKLGG